MTKDAQQGAYALKSTPGPWRLHDMERATIVAGRPGAEVANCLNGFGDQDANAHLIAAAPELYEALRELIELVDADATFENRDVEPYKYEAVVDDIKRRAADALAKARGEQ